MQASQMELRSTSSMGSSIASTTAKAFSTSFAREALLTLFSTMEHVTWFGRQPLACISPTRPHIASGRSRTTLSNNSLYVTQFGFKPPRRMASTSSRARRTLPLRKYALIIVLYVTTSAVWSLVASPINFSARARSSLSTQASSMALQSGTDFTAQARNTAMLSSRRRSCAKDFSKETWRETSAEEPIKDPSTSSLLDLNAASAISRSAETSKPKPLPDKWRW
mmetsp:Transcript_105071/g.303977  ORF Transcript_105071/g.303977 Transcript_105071/m.303977 type:complete len:223 (-) Transcript_105071:97-765(-)